MKYALDTNLFLDGFRSEEAQEEVFGFLRHALPFTYLSAVVMQELAAGARTADAARALQRGVFDPFERRRAASCRDQGITLITKDGDFKRLAPLIKGFRYAAPWPTAADARR